MFTSWSHCGHMRLHFVTICVCISVCLTRARGCHVGRTCDQRMANVRPTCGQRVVNVRPTCDQHAIDVALTRSIHILTRVSWFHLVNVMSTSCQRRVNVVPTSCQRDPTLRRHKNRTAKPIVCPGSSCAAMRFARPVSSHGCRPTSSTSTSSRVLWTRPRLRSRMATRPRYRRARSVCP